MKCNRSVTGLNQITCLRNTVCHIQIISTPEETENSLRTFQLQAVPVGKRHYFQLSAEWYESFCKRKESDMSSVLLPSTTISFRPTKRVRPNTPTNFSSSVAFRNPSCMVFQSSLCTQHLNPETIPLHTCTFYTEIFSDTVLPVNEYRLGKYHKVFLSVLHLLLFHYLQSELLSPYGYARSGTVFFRSCPLSWFYPFVELQLKGLIVAPCYISSV